MGTVSILCQRGHIRSRAQWQSSAAWTVPDIGRARIDESSAQRSECHPVAARGDMRLREQAWTDGVLLLRGPAIASAHFGVSLVFRTQARRGCSGGRHLARAGMNALDSGNSTINRWERKCDIQGEDILCIFLKMLFSFFIKRKVLALSAHHEESLASALILSFLSRCSILLTSTCNIVHHIFGWPVTIKFDT